MTITLQSLLKREDVKEYSRIKSPIAILALHGGGIEPGTEQIARFISENTTSSLYVFSARRYQGNYELHIKSTEISPKQSEQLTRVVQACKTGISIHGHNRNTDTVFISGTNQDLLNVITSSIKQVLGDRYRLDTKDVPLDLNCSDPSNVLNKFPLGGVQIELPPTLREAKTGSGFNRHEFSTLYKDTKLFAQAIVAAVKNYKLKI